MKARCIVVIDYEFNSFHEGAHEEWRINKLVNEVTKGNSKVKFVTSTLNPTLDKGQKRRK